MTASSSIRGTHVGGLRRRVLRSAWGIGAIVGIASTMLVSGGGVADATTTHERGARPGSTASSFALPTGFQPEGIDVRTIDGRSYAFVTSLRTGAVWRQDLVAGTGSVIGGTASSPSIGDEVDDRGRVFVASGPGGFIAGDSGAGARVLDGRTGKVLAEYRFSTGPSLVNDVTVAGGAAWFTDTINPVVYRLPLARDGRLPGPKGFSTLHLTGDYRYDDSASTIDGNGITPTPDGKALIVIQYRTGKLFRLDPRTGATRRIDTHGRLFKQGDGLTLRGRTLYIPQNTNRIAVLRLDARGTAGRLVQTIRSSAFDGPTNVAFQGDRLWVVNARFGLAVPREGAFTVSSLTIGRNGLQR